MITQIQERPWRNSATGQMSPAAAALVGRLWAYAFATLQALLRSGEIEKRLARLNVPAAGELTSTERDAIHESRQVREDLAAGMLDKALPAFMDRLTADRWDPDRAALATYFVNACLLRYNQVLAEWKRGFRHLLASIDEVQLRQVRQDHQNRVAERLQLQSLISHAPPTVRPILSMLWLGYSVREIAEVLHVQPVTIRQRLAYYRKATIAPKVATGRIVVPSGYSLAQYNLVNDGYYPEDDQYVGGVGAEMAW